VEWKTKPTLQKAIKMNNETTQKENISDDIKHFPVPWVVKRDGGYWGIFGADGKMIVGHSPSGIVPIYGRAQQIIVDCVNAVYQEREKK